MPRWAGPRGRLRLSRLAAFEHEQEIEAERQAQYRQHEAPSSQLSLPLAEPKRPPKPLPDDWMFR